MLFLALPYYDTEWLKHLWKIWYKQYKQTVNYSYFTDGSLFVQLIKLEAQSSSSKGISKESPQDPVLLSSKCWSIMPYCVLTSLRYVCCKPIVNMTSYKRAASL